MRTICTALILTLVGAHSALAQEPVAVTRPLESIPSRTLHGTWYTPGAVVTRAPRTERVARRALFRAAVGALVRETSGHDRAPRSVHPSSKADSVAIGAAVGAVFALAATGNGCGCTTAKDLVIGAGVGGIIGAVVHDK